MKNISIVLIALFFITLGCGKECTPAADCTPVALAMVIVGTWQVETPEFIDREVVFKSDSTFIDENHVLMIHPFHSGTYWVESDSLFTMHSGNVMWGPYYNFMVTDFKCDRISLSFTRNSMTDDYILLRK